jgi:hypothetical protein
MKKLTVNCEDRRAIAEAIRYARRWSREHQMEIGVAEMGLGASIIAIAVHSGAIEIGRDLIATATTKVGLGSKVGGGAGVSVGAAAGGLLGSIGVATAGSAVGIPAAVVIGGGAVIVGAMGYTAGDLIEKYLRQTPTIGDVIGSVGALAVGLGLLIDGGRRIIKDPRVRARMPFLARGTIYLPRIEADVVARNAAELRGLTGAALAGGLSAAGGGMAAAGILGTTGVTLAGSQSLGAAAVSMGLIAPPVWPVILGAGAGFTVACAVWAAYRQLRTEGHAGR